MLEQMQEHTSRDTGCAGAGGCLNTWWLPTRSHSKVHLPICLATNPSKKSSDAPSMTTAYPAETKGSWGAPAVVGGPGSHAAAVWSGGQPCPSSAAIRATAPRGKVGTQLPLLLPLSGAAAFEQHLLCLYGHIVSLLGKTAAEIQKSSEAGAADALPSSGSQHAHGSH